MTPVPGGGGRDRRPPPPWRILAALTVALAACGGDGDGDGAGAIASTTSTTAEATAASAGAMTREEGDDLRTRLATTDLTVDVTAPARAEVGGTLTVEVVVDNLGPNPSTSTTLVLTRRGPLDWSPPPECVSTGGEGHELRCQLDEMLAGTERRVTVTGHPLGAGSVTVRATVVNNAGPDADPSTNESEATTTVVGT